MGLGAKPARDSTGYVASKGALNTLTRHFAVKWAKSGI